MFKTSPNRTYHKSTKRKQVDPTTCERDYSADEIEFMQALERYKVSSGRKFPTCSEILEVLRSIGYEKIQVRSIQAVATLDELERVVEEELS
jgi:hypothetical protein